MIKKRVFIITVLVLSVIIGAQTVIIIKPTILDGQEVTDPENAIIIAKAALLQKYGEAELSKVKNEFHAVIFGEQPAYCAACC